MDECRRWTRADPQRRCGMRAVRSCWSVQQAAVPSMLRGAEGERRRERDGGVTSDGHTATAPVPSVPHSAADQEPWHVPQVSWPVEQGEGGLKGEWRGRQQ